MSNAKSQWKTVPIPEVVTYRINLKTGKKTLISVKKMKPPKTWDRVIYIDPETGKRSTKPVPPRVDGKGWEMTRVYRKIP